MLPRLKVSGVALLALSLAACGGGDSSAPAPSTPATPSTPAPTPAGLYSVPAAEALSVADVQRILAQAVGEARARSLPAVIAVTDRVGNVLAVYSMAGARPTMTLRPGPSGNLDAQGAVVPAAAGAIAKAVTGAYLSSGGNAFSTRTASMIVQPAFPPSPATQGLESGPLFGVQFSQLPCSDLARRFTGTTGADAFIGPKRSPLGLAGDPGGFPLYKNGVLVGGIGVMADGDYGFDPNVLDKDDDAEEAIALAASTGFTAPDPIKADFITVDGTSLRYSDATTASFKSNPANAAAAPSGGTLTPVTGYFDGTVIAGQAYGSEASGVRKATAAEFDNADAFVLSDGAGNDRFPIRAGTDAEGGAQPLTAAEVKATMEEAFKVMSRARAQIRRPLDSRAQVSISMVDTRGVVLGIVRAPDAPIFGIDVSLQKARTATFFSGSNAAADLAADPSADVQGFVAKARAFLGDNSALSGKTAFAARSIGNLSRPHFPDGEVAKPNGPFSRPIAQWSPFSTGLQSALVNANLMQHVGYVTGAGPDTPARCTALPDVAPGQNRLQNGIQIFSGAVPVYRDGKLVGGIGVSGDGIDQDDMIGFLGLANAGSRVPLRNADAAIRADQVVAPGTGGVRLRYVNCPFAPFLDTADQNVCSGK